MRGRRVISLGGSNKRVLIPLLLGAQVTYRLAEATHSRFRAIDRQLSVCGRVSCTGAGDLVGRSGYSPGRPISGTFFVR